MAALLYFLGLTVAAAKPAGKPTSGGARPAAARKLVDEGGTGLATDKLAPARQKLEQAYATSPSLDGLYQLGRLAEAQGRAVPAADFFRRYLAASGRDGDEQIKVDLRRYVTSIQEPTSEVDVVSGDAGALLRLDGDVAGVLPLSGPLLVSAGEHRFTIEKDGQKFQTSPQPLPSGQRAQLQVTLESRYAVLTLTPALVLLIEPSILDEGVQAQLFSSVAEAAQKERSFLIDREQTRAALIKSTTGFQGACAGDLLCQQALARQLDAAGALTIRAQVSEASLSQVAVQLLDISTGIVIGGAGEVCASCSTSEAKDALLSATRKLLQDASTRGRGTLQVVSSLAGAKVLVDGRELGAIPFSREAFEGSHDIAIQQDGYIPFKTTAQVTRGQTAVVGVELQRVPAPISPVAIRPVRPRWRFAIGGIAVGASLILAGFGASALVAQGSCVDVPMEPTQTCNNVYATKVVGAALTFPGGILAIGGTALMAWPAK